MTCVPVRIRRVLVLGVLSAVPSMMPLLATQVASIRPHSAHSWVFPSTFGAHRVVNVVTLLPTIIPLLRVISLLSLASEISFYFVPPGLFGTLGRVADLAF